LTPVLESTNRKRPEEEPIARRKRERAAQLIEYRRSSNSSFEKTRPTMKITYFDIRGRAETARLVLAYAEVSFEDDRLPFPPNEVWAAKKPSVTLGQLPTLEVEGKTLHQSMAIARYLAKENGLAGANNLEGAQCDEIVDFVSDMQQAIVRILLSSGR